MVSANATGYTEITQSKQDLKIRKANPGVSLPIL